MILSFSPNKIRQRGILWAGLIVLCLAYLAARIFLNETPILNTNLLALLPASEQSETLQQAEKQMLDVVEKNIVVLLSSPDKAAVIAAATFYHKTSADSSLFADRPQGLHTLGSESIEKLYRRVPLAVMSEKDRRYLRQGDVEALLKEKLAALYGPIGIQSLLPLDRDPLMLFSDGVMSHVPDVPVNLAMEKGIPYVKKQGVYHAIVSLLLTESPYSTDYQSQVMAQIAEISSAVHQTFPALEITLSGVIFHAAKGMRDGKSEVSIMSLIAVMGILLLFLFTFRSLKPFLATLLVIATGILASLAVSLLVFEQIYLITLVFGTSLIGISVDYAFHYFAEKYRGAEITSGAGLRHILSGITLGCLTSVIGFAGLLVAPFPGLVQMALFCCVGLIVAYGGVICFFPLIAKLENMHCRPVVYRGIRRYFLFLQKLLAGRRRAVILISLLVIIGGGLTKVEFGDDLRSLQNLSPQLLANDQKIRDVLHVNPAAQFFLVTGVDENDMLEKDAHLLNQLDDLATRGLLMTYNGLSRFVPPQSEQNDNRALVIAALTSNSAEIMEKLSPLGMSEVQIERYLAYLRATEGNFLTLADIKSTALWEGVSHLYLGHNSSLVSLGEVKDTTALAALATSLPGVTFVDKVDLISRVFSDYRHKIVLLTLMAYGLIGFLLLYRYGVRKAILTFLPLVLAVSLTIAVMGYIGTQVTLFHVIATLLIMGVCIDYAIFLAEIKGEGSAEERVMPTLIAISLSAVTTIVSYGMLTFSSMTILHDIGAIIFMGILFSFLFATGNVNITAQENEAG